MNHFNILSDRLDEHFQKLAAIGNLGSELSDGFLRHGWSDEESAAIAYIQAVGVENGLLGRYDEVGNFYLRTPRGGPKVVQIGSHLDTVPYGGLFDGGVGIIAGLESILAIHRSDVPLQAALELVIWRGEEGANFGLALKGSSAAFGRLDPVILERETDGLTLEQAIVRQGYSAAPIRERRPTLGAAEIDNILAHFELHIEQARKLELDRTDIGIVTSIRGAARFRVELRGEAAHSGATPMGLPYRRDAVLAMAHIVTALNQACSDAIENGDDLVLTVGVVNADRGYNEAHPEIYENAITKVSPFCYFLLDIRSNSPETLERYLPKFHSLIESTAARFEVETAIQPLGRSTALPSLDPELQTLAEQCCRMLGYTSQRMPCGAGHDIAVVASHPRSDGRPIPGALLFIPCRDGISHNPKEFAETEAVRKGAELLAACCQQVAGKGA